MLDKIVWKYNIPNISFKKIQIEYPTGINDYNAYFPLLKKINNGFVIVKENNIIEFFDFQNSKKLFSSPINSNYIPISFFDVIE
jgi:hypothetical protein